MTALDSALCARLVSEARKDAPMLEAFREFGDSYLIRTKHGAFGTYAVVKVLERERELADQLEAVLAENARLAQRARDQDEELQAHAERGYHQLMEAKP